ncbi:hypothetical protein OG429_04545 [Streptomyces sp. NBC_00190]|uniref:hypothetical protein n=1 Tax=unclassified Streptomyces TaxID=2593676 RepID=UPI002E2C45DE|nr:hypothetical protein [Streptomyces sp. NBC_00190]WSZ38659.1 hypothetical protein OG239_07550 [Streptomyces sp. NBC_00868]
MEAIHETYAVLDGAYWLDDTGTDTGTGTDGDRAHCARCARPHGAGAPDAVPEPGQKGLLERLQSALTCANAGRLRAVMLTCSVGTFIAGAEAALRR